jgi:hypothetical protein
MIDFISTCPFLYITGDILPMAFDPTSPPESNALAYLGSTRPIRQPDIRGNRIVQKTASFALYLRRFSNDPELREETGDFISDFENWIEYENVLRENPAYPMFSETDYQLMFAANGMWWQKTETPNLDEYLIQVNVEYQTEYFKEVTKWLMKE